MSSDVPHRIDRLDFMQPQFARLVERSNAKNAHSHAWHDYTLLLVSCAEAFSRMPMTEEECNTIDIDEHLAQELSYLSYTIDRIFPKSAIDRILAKSEVKNVVPKEES